MPSFKIMLNFSLSCKHTHTTRSQQAIGNAEREKESQIPKVQPHNAFMSRQYQSSVTGSLGSLCCVSRLANVQPCRAAMLWPFCTLLNQRCFAKWSACVCARVSLCLPTECSCFSNAFPFVLRVQQNETHRVPSSQIALIYYLWLCKKNGHHRYCPPMEMPLIFHRKLYIY